MVPFAYKLLKWNYLIGSSLILCICIVFNIFCSKYCPELLWRLLAVRYWFLFVIGWIWFKSKEISNRSKGIFFSLGIISLLYLVFFSNNNWSPYIYHGSWNSQNYPVYFWTLVLIIILIQLALHSSSGVQRKLQWLGINSWEVFLAQMFIIGFVRSLPEVLNPVFTSVLYLLFIFITSIGSVTVYQCVKRKVKKEI